MSNLLKQRNAISGEKGTRIINSNDKVEQKLMELKRKAMMEAKGGGFVSGLASLSPTIPVPEEPEETLEEIRREAEILIEAARDQAGEILKHAREQAKEIQSAAKREGYQQGNAEAKVKAEAELAVEMDKLAEKARQLQEEHDKSMDDLEPELVNVVAEVFERVFHVYFDDKKDVLLYLISQAIYNTENEKNFQIRVGEANYPFMETHKGEILDRVGQSVNLEILADAELKDNQCLIETESGVFDCSLGVQLENLIKTLRALSSTA
ncbi:hypothetical protein FACS1894111_02400 [Clostridia bacterium]|nr:hypothetical protein FACS1894111_02400 [Clostridia bacterium]